MGGVAAVSASATRVAPSRGRERKIPGGTSGRRTLLSNTTKTTSSTTENPRDARVAGANGPTSCTLVIPYTSSVRPAVTLTAPATSRRGGAVESRLSETRKGASAIPANPTGTLMRNTHSHPNAPVSRPPRSQPVAPPPAAAAVQTPSARPRPLPSEKAAVNEESADGATIAAPNPCATRAQQSQGRDRQPIRQRSCRKHRQPDHEQPPPLPEIRHPAGEQQKATKRERVRRYNPLKPGLRKPQLVLYLGKRNGHDGRV